METKRGMRTYERTAWRRGGRPCHQCDPGEGVPVLYLALQSQSLLFIQHCNVWHFLQGGGGGFSHCFPWLLFDWLHVLKCQQLMAPFVQLALFIPEK